MRISEIRNAWFVRPKIMKGAARTSCSRAEYQMEGLRVWLTGRGNEEGKGLM